MIVSCTTVVHVESRKTILEDEWPVLHVPKESVIAASNVQNVMGDIMLLSVRCDRDDPQSLLNLPVSHLAVV